MSHPRSSISLVDTATGLDPVSPVPLHRQLRDRIAQALACQEVPPGTLLPGEHTLCHDFGVSRTVVRHALAQLEADGMVERVKGKGTFVARHRTPERLAHTLLGLHEEATARGAQVRSVVRRLEWVLPEPAVAEALAVPACDRVLELGRLRLVDSEPWSLTTTWLPARLADPVLAEDFTTASLYATLRAHGTSATSGVRAVEAVTATPPQAELLAVAAGDPLLVLHSVSYDQHGDPMEVFIAYHRGDRSRFEFHLQGASAVSGDGPAGTTSEGVLDKLRSVRPLPPAPA